MAATKRKSSTKKTAVRSKSKVAKKATAKRVSRAKVAPKKAAAAAVSSAAKKAPSAANAATAQSDAVMKMGADSIRQMMSQISSGMGQEDLQKQVYSMSQEGAAQMAKSADAASRSVYEILDLGKDNVDAAVACSSVAVNASKSMGAELFNYANKSFSQNVEMSKELFGCRTLNDMFDLQSKVVKANLDHFFNESVKMSEMMFQSANEISEPLNERVNESTQRLSKAMADAV